MKNSDLARKLKDAIDGGAYPPGARLPSARQLAREYGVGYLTADRALNRLAGEGWVRRIPRSGTFVRDRRGEAFLIGFSDAHFNDPAFDLAAGTLRRMVLEEFRKLNCKVRLLAREDLRDPEWLGELDLLLVAHAVEPGLRKTLETLPVPVLQFRSESVRELPFHQVTIDLAPGFAALFRRVRPERFRRLVILTEGHELSHLRRDMALRFAAESGFAADAIECIDTFGADYPLWKRLCRECRDTFFFTCGDLLAAGLTGVALAEGVAVGRELMLAGYDNLESCGYLPFGKPLFTAVGYDRREAARAIAKLAHRLLAEPGDAELRTIVSIPTRLTFRQTFPETE